MMQNEIAELQVQEKINNYVDNFDSFRFNAGAGAGKTYALIETLKYVTANKIAAKKSPQKVACITYTNVAVNEIRSRLGDSDKVRVSTIHESLWEIIKRAQPQLLMCHKEKIREVIDQSDHELLYSDKAQFFIDLDDCQKKEFIDFATQTKELFYQAKNLSAASFRNAYYDSDFDLPEFLDKCMKNVGKFRYTVSLLYKKQRLLRCLEKIDAGEEKRVYYDSKVNADRLHYMKFSHDTLLEYGLKLVKNYPALCRIIVDVYPYFFIDEYQDTHRNVVKFAKIVHDYAIGNNRKWVVGYFGDTAQSIYDDGVGRRIVDLHDGLFDVYKIYNRRSHQQIIDVANKIRDDEIVQKPIFEERTNGSVCFFYNSSEEKLAIAQQFLDDYKDHLAETYSSLGGAESKKNKINCLVLTNKLMAKFNGFGDVYDVYQSSSIYYDNLNTQVLSQKLDKLHPTVLTIYRLVKLYHDIHQGQVSYYDVFGASSKDITFSKASLVVRELEKKEVLVINDWVDSIADLLENSEAKKELGKAIVNRVSYEQDKVVSSEVFRETLLGDIDFLMNEEAEDEDTAKGKVDRFLALPIQALRNWVDFIDGIEVGDISFHTYHGTKGEEYENVAIILEHSFGSKNIDKFKKFFKVIQGSKEEKERLLAGCKEKEQYINTQNLLYVACSRAIKNLRILYLDDISEIKSGVEVIFGESKPWPNDEACCSS